jgi:hypothetical protein
VLSDVIGLTAALACLSALAAGGAAWTWTVGLRSLSGLVAPAPGTGPLTHPTAE